MQVSQCRTPCGLVKINGEVMPGWISWEVDNNTFYQADTFRCRFALSMMPSAFNKGWWSKQRSIMVEILAGFPADPERFDASELDSLIYGKVDNLDVDLCDGVLDLCGRDLTADMIDTKVTEEFRNQKAWEIASTIAKRHGLTPVVTKTESMTGAYYEIDHSRYHCQRSEWDLLCEEAEKEQFMVFVKGKELHFEPPKPQTDAPYIIQWDEKTDDRGFPISNAKALSFGRAMTVSKGVVVTVSSWNPKTKQQYLAVYPKVEKNQNAGGAKLVPTLYEFNKPGLLPDKALQFAKAHYREITQHELEMRVELPGDNLLQAGMPIRASGTGMDFDQTYTAYSVSRRMSMGDGYAMSVLARSVSAELAKEQTPELLVAAGR